MLAPALALVMLLAGCVKQVPVEPPAGPPVLAEAPPPVLAPPGVWVRVLRPPPPT
jgi:hypothetical protein